MGVKRPIPNGDQSAEADVIDDRTAVCGLSDPQVGTDPLSSGPLNVLVLTPWFPNFPGDRQGNFVFDSASALAERGASVCVAVVRPWVPRWLEWLRPKWEPDRFRYGAFPQFKSIALTRYLSIPRDLMWRVSEWNRSRAVHRAVRITTGNFEPHVVHAHTEGMAAIAAEVGKFYGIPAVVSLHGINTARRYFRGNHGRHIVQALRRADRLILVGEPLRPFFRELVGTDRHMRVVHNGARFSEDDDVRPRFSDDQGFVRFVSVSNLHEGKGIDVALRALFALRNKGYDNWEYAIAGDGAERAKLELLCAELNLSERVTFLGMVPYSETQKLMEGADVFLLPSYREAFGIVYAEAMAAGALAIGVKGQGPSAFIDHRKNGFLAEPKDVPSLCECIEEIFVDPARMRQIARAGAAHVRANFGWSDHAQKLEYEFSEIIAAHARG